MERQKWWSSRVAHRITIALIILQLGGCVLDMTTEQMSAMSLFCMVPIPANALISWSLFGSWLVLTFAWIVGLVSLGIPRLRPVHWLLVLLIPVGFVGQQVMLNEKIVHCDAP